MSSFDIGLYMSVDLYNAHGNTPLDRAELHLDDAINNYSQHSVSINKHGGGGISAPIEKVGPSFYTDDIPCRVPTEDRQYWEGLGEWWYSYTQYCAPSEDDAVVLITSGEWGGEYVGRCWNDYACVCEGGQYLPDLPKYDAGPGSGIEYQSINNVLHEIGHAIISDNVDEHAVYNTYQYSNGKYGKTAMETGNRSAIDTNECGKSVHSPTNDYEATGYSNCAEDKM